VRLDGAEIESGRTTENLDCDEGRLEFNTGSESREPRLVATVAWSRGVAKDRPMLMFPFLAIPLCIAVLVGVVLVRSRQRGLRGDLGTVSERWLAEQRAAAYEPHR